MTVCFGENKRLRDFLTARKQCRKQILLERANHGTDLARIYDSLIKLSLVRTGIILIFVHLLPASFP